MNFHIKPTVISVDVATVNDWLSHDEAVLIDVRETSEFDLEHIPGALLQPMSVFDPELFPKVPGKKLVLHCAIGKRSEAAGKMLLQQGHENVMHMSGGLKEWKAAGFETEEQFIPPVPEKADILAKSAGPIISAKPGEILLNEFIKPHKLTVMELAIAIGVPAENIDQVIKGDTAITAEMSLRLARYFCTDNDFWLGLQLKSDIEAATRSIGAHVFEGIAPRLCA
jgi:addiction module HigA family antidote